MSNVVKHYETPSTPARAFDMAEVGEEAQAVLANAEESARRIVAEAQAEAESRRAEAWEAGFAEGKAALVGRLEQQIAEDLQRRRGAEVANLVQALRSAVDEISRRRDQIARESKDQLIALAVDVARIIVKREVALSPEIARLNLEEAIRLSARRARLIARVSETDMKTLEVLLGEAPLAAAGDSPVEIVPSQDVPPGGCVVESASGAVDARVETQLREIEKTLLGAAPRGPDREEAAHGR